MHTHQIFGMACFNAFAVLFAQVHCIQILYTSQLTLNHKLINFQVYLQFYNVLYLISSLKFSNYIKNVFTLKAKYNVLNILYKLWSIELYDCHAKIGIILPTIETIKRKNMIFQYSFCSFSAKGNWLWHSVFVEFEWLLTNDDK